MRNRNGYRKRKPEFRINTRVSGIAEKKFLVKSADSEASLEFLKQIIEKENAAKHLFEGYAEVVVGTLKDNSIYYNYIGSPTLEELVAVAIKSGDIAFGKSIVEEYVRFIRRLPSTKCQPDEFMKELGIHPKEMVELPCCILFGPIDCIPSNILVGGQSWHIVDHEWTFEFPLPVDFLIYRGIASLVVRLQDCIQSSISKDQPVQLICGFGKNRTYIPCSWLDLLYGKEIPIGTLHHWEYLFQQKVLTTARLGHLRLKKNRPAVSSLTQPLTIVSALISICIELKYRFGQCVARIRRGIGRLLPNRFRR